MQCRVRSNRSAISRCVYSARSPFSWRERRTDSRIQRGSAEREGTAEGNGHRANECVGRKWGGLNVGARLSLRLTTFFIPWHRSVWTGRGHLTVQVPRASCRLESKPEGPSSWATWSTTLSKTMPLSVARFRGGAWSVSLPRPQTRNGTESIDSRESLSTCNGDSLRRSSLLLLPPGNSRWLEKDGFRRAAEMGRRRRMEGSRWRDSSCL